MTGWHPGHPTESLPHPMDLWIVIGAVVLAGCVAWGAWVVWRLRWLTTTVEHCIRRQYEDQSTVRDAARRQSDALAILRVQLAQVVAGNRLDATLVEAGCLYREISAEDARQMVPAQPSTANAEMVIVDVRSHSDFLASHIPGARHVPFESLETSGQRDVPREAATVLIYCAQGERSRLACDFLSRRGYMNLVTIRDGFQRWTGPVLGTGHASLLHIQPAAKSKSALSDVEPAKDRHG